MSDFDTMVYESVNRDSETEADYTCSYCHLKLPGGCFKGRDGKMYCNVCLPNPEAEDQFILVLDTS